MRNPITHLQYATATKPRRRDSARPRSDRPFQSSVAKELRNLDPAGDDPRWKELSEIFLQELYVPVTQQLSDAFAKVRDDVSSETATLAEIAQEVLGLEVAPRDLEIPQIEIEYAVWRPVAQATVLLLLDWLVDEVRQKQPVTEPMPITDWSSMTKKTLYDAERFYRLTALSDTDSEIALNTAAQAIASWAPIDEGVPLRYLGRKVLVKGSGPQGNETIVCTPL